MLERTWLTEEMVRKAVRLARAGKFSNRAPRGMPVSRHNLFLCSDGTVRVLPPGSWPGDVKEYVFLDGNLARFGRSYQKMMDLIENWNE